MKKLTFEQQLAPFWSAPLEDVRHFTHLLSMLIEIRNKCCAPSVEADPVDRNIILATGSPTHIPRRSPLKMPKPGSLRAVLRNLLMEAGTPLPRAEIIKQAAALRGTRNDTAFKAKVGDLLNHPHDPCFRKISRGVYAANE